MFIRITACLLADPLSGLLHQGLRTFHYFHARLGCYRLERKLPGGFNALPLEFCAFPRRTKTGSKTIGAAAPVAAGGSFARRMGHTCR